MFYLYDFSFGPLTPIVQVCQADSKVSTPETFLVINELCNKIPNFRQFLKLHPFEQDRINEAEHLVLFPLDFNQVEWLEVWTYLGKFK